MSPLILMHLDGMSSSLTSSALQGDRCGWVGCCRNSPTIQMPKAVALGTRASLLLFSTPVVVLVEFGRWSTEYCNKIADE